MSKVCITALVSASLFFAADPALAFKGGGPYGSEVMRGQELTGKDFCGTNLIKHNFKTWSGSWAASISRDSGELPSQLKENMISSGGRSRGMDSLFWGLSVVSVCIMMCGSCGGRVF
ncbi:unnamed protein product [Lactuca virosa]|uniref:Uncharacterized protein n=1 Tax=Lactuca virosa TaxID=75947 RepID=A0AAU9MRR1_9ASTR|nr:unnamed protein product [Lactuca virosa]